ncbi:MAG: fasciclin domain-containing protein [Cyclobacteriaceae bacterium]|nr:fasciclin domain-containing protein [Cyclobacteriaceae bacterium SS2]
MKKTVLKKINVQLLVLLAMAASLLTISACNDDNDMDDMGPDENIVELAEGTPSLSTLVSAIVAADLTATLEGDGPFTVFAPTNDAFNGLPAGVLDYLLDNPAELAAVLQYHVVSGKVLSTDLSSGTVATLNGNIEVNVSSGVTINSTANVITADVEATNGVVHIIDEVLIPEGFELPPTEDIIELAQGTSTLSTLVTAITTADLVATLQGDGPFTVFAPTNEAFENLPDGVLDYLLENPTELAGILQYHVVSGSVLSTDLSTGAVATLNGDINVDVSAGVVINGSASVVTADIQATNGIVHIIDEVLIPEGFEVPKTIVELASETEDLSTLVTALTLFPDLVSTLEGDGTFTVFAPTNEAFAGLLAAIGQTDLNDIPESVVRSLLEYHVISSAALMSTDLSNGQTAETVNGENITVAIDGSDVFISDSKVLTANVEASNGVVHIVENVMVPPSILPVVGTIVAPAYFNKDFSTLIAAVEAADEDILSVLLGTGTGDGLTLFAPTNAAFEAAGITSLPDGATLSAVLKYHVVDGTVFAADLPTTGAGASAIESLGGTFYLSNKGTGAGVFINGSTQVTVTDIQGSNGVVHVIDRTILPPSNNIVEIAQSFDPDEFTQLVAAVARTSGEATDLLAALSGDGDFTVFAPTDAAFQALLDTDASWNTVNDIPLATLTAVLQHHVVASARVFSSDLATGAATTLNGDVNIDATAGTITDGSGAAANLSSDASLLNVLATNGVIHVIDKVLLP